MKRRDSGFTLIEILIAVAIVGFVLAAASTFFIMSVKQYKTQTKIVETNIEGILGLELLRRDMESLGFGLPWNNLPTSTPLYSETSADNLSTLNDFPNAPRAAAGIDNAAFTVNRSDYLTVKSVTVGTADAAGKWTTLTQAGTTRNWGSTEENIAGTEYVIVLALGSTDANRRSLVNPASPYAQFSSTAAYVPTEPYSANIVYGVDGSPPMRPFNRADYYVANASSNPPVTVPLRCAPNTGVLVKGFVSHDNNGTLNLLPLLDCVADMQVVYGLDVDGNGSVDQWTNAGGLPAAGATAAATMRTQLREIRVSILAQEGMRDDSYTHPVNPIYVGMADAGFGNNFDITGYTNYRWKVYHLAVKPWNLAQ
ncbi:MAG: PilW family protein [Deltaproteobacteria bacterium]|nr:PilW family protein [Deltaproteobacteria bacterium]